MPAPGKPLIGSVRREHVRGLHYAMWVTQAMAKRTLDLLSGMFNMGESG